ncbi:MAG: c-type cytochrome [Opitutaceae bacterium]
MKPLSLGWAALALAVGATSHAEPRVAGFDRFHAASPDVGGGRVLFNELGCTGCHGGETGLPPRRGPDLATATSRARAEWLRAFITDPARHRAGTAMPALLAEDQQERADAIVHYLGSLAPKAAAGRVKPLRHINVAFGRELYHSRGCVACHEPRENDVRPGDQPAVARGGAFPDLIAKYTLGTLSEFLRDPLKARPDGRMPRIELDEQDAVDIAGYLLGAEGSDGEALPKLEAFRTDPARAEVGKVLVREARCASCHTLPKDVTTAAVPLRNADGGCLGETPAAGLPRYALNPPQRAALRAYLAARDTPLAPSSRVALTLEALNCLGCHERDGRGGPEDHRRVFFEGDHNLGDAGSLPPPLTGIGRKLQPDWLEQVLKGGGRVRPYLKTAMPVHGTATNGLASLLAEVDARAERLLPPGEVEAGRKLLGSIGGVNCVTCHRWGANASLGIQGPDISNLARRLRPGWLREYLIDPSAHRPGTLMPSFWPGGMASNREILGGDTDRQIASILEFARAGKGLPEGITPRAAGEFELVPGARPVVLRTFLEEAGTHAILVGFPAGVHLAYDGRAARPVLAWKGRFFDAYGTWFSRFAPFGKPLGEAVVRWAGGSDPTARRFDGYRLDAGGTPTFLLSVDGVAVEERFEATPQGLRRTVRWNAEALRAPGVTHPAGVTVTEERGGSPGNLSFLYQW